MVLLADGQTEETAAGQDECYYTFGPRWSLHHYYCAMHIACFYTGSLGDAPDTSPPSSLGVPDPPILSSQTPAGEDAADDGTGPTLSEVLHTIKVNHTALTGTVTEIKTDLAIMRHNVQKLRGRITETERRISDLEDIINPLLPKINIAGGKIASLEDKVDDLENRLHRNNLRLVGLPKRVEGSDPVAFMKSWLEQEFGRALLSPFFVIEWPHWVPG